jgi:hypothetical protein
VASAANYRVITTIREQTNWHSKLAYTSLSAPGNENIGKHAQQAQLAYTRYSTKYFVANVYEETFTDAILICIALHECKFETGYARGFCNEKRAAQLFLHCKR